MQGHLHKLTKLVYKSTHCKPIKPSERASAVVSFAVVFGMFAGAVAGALVMHTDPLGGDNWMFVPVALMLLAAVELHDAALEPPEGWGSTTENTTAATTNREPLLPVAGESTRAIGAGARAAPATRIGGAEVGAATDYVALPVSSNPQ